MGGGGGGGRGSIEGGSKGTHDRRFVSSQDAPEGHVGAMFGGH